MITDKRIIELWNAASNAATSKLDWTYSEIIFATVRAVIAEHDAELRKQEPVAYTFKQEGSPAYTNNPSFMKLNTQYVYEPLYAAPIPPDNHDWKAEYLRQVDLHNQTLDELREAEMQLRNPAPTPPTPTPIQQEALMRVDLIGTPAEVIPMDRDLLRDFILARPDTEGSGK